MRFPVPAAASTGLLPALVLFGLFAAGSGGCGGGPDGARGGAASGPETLRVTRGSLIETILLTGEIEAARAEPLIAPDVGIWPLEVRWLAEHGSRVRAGEQIAEFGNGSLTTQLDSVRARIERREQELRGEESQRAIDLAEAVFTVEQRLADLRKAELEADVPPDLIAARELQEKELARERARVELDKARAHLRSKQEVNAANDRASAFESQDQDYELQRILRSLERLELKAPRDGLVEVARSPREERLFQAGDTVQPGWTVARVPDLDSLRVRARLFDVDDGRLHAGLPATVTLDAFPQLRFRGRVTDIDAIARQIGRESLRRVFEVVVELDERDIERMRPGMSVKVEIERDHGEVLQVPRRALQVAGDGIAKVTLGDGRRVEVQVGPCAVFTCAVLGGEATEGTGSGSPLTTGVELMPARGAS